MLKQLRNKKNAKKVWIVLAIIIVPAFVLWGSGSLTRNRDETKFAGKIYGRNIPFTELRDNIDAVRHQAIIQFGDSFSEMEKYLNLESQAWERIIVLQEAKKRRIKATDQEVVNLIESYPFFQRNGQFDQKIYEEILHYSLRTQPRIFEEETRRNLIISKLYNQVTEGIKVTDEEVRDSFLKANEELSVNFIAGLLADFAKNITPTDQEIKDYFSKNPLNFKQPLSYNVEYIASDSENKIKEALTFLNKKESMDKTAKSLGLTFKETGLFSQTDPIPGIGWSPEILNIVDGLKAGEYSQALHIDKNYYVLRLKEKKGPYVPDFEKIKDKVKDTLAKETASKMAKEKTEAALNKLKEARSKNEKSVDFDKCAKEFGLKSEATAFFKFGSYIEGIGASDKLWLTAKALKDDEFSDIISLPTGYYIIKLKAKNPIDEKKLEKDKADLGKKLLSEKKQEAFGRFMDELKKKA